MKMEYTKIPLDRLDRIRAELHRLLDSHGFTLRTFYLGPRERYLGSSVGRTTNKTNAYAAKIAVYNSKGDLLGYYKEASA